MELVLKRAAGATRALALPAAVTGWALVVVTGHLLGVALGARDPLVHINAPPLVGSFDLRLSARVVPALVLVSGHDAFFTVLVAGYTGALGLSTGRLLGRRALAA